MFDRTRKGDASTDLPGSNSFSSPPPAPAVDTTTRPASASAGTAPRGRATAVIGPSIQIEGTLRGQEDVSVEGEVTGTIQLQSNTLTVGTQGKIKADVYAHTIFVEGTVEGDLFGSEQVIVRKSAKVRGNITSPRVSLEDGATFKGSIEMDPESVKSVLGTGQSNRGASTSASRSNVAQPVGTAAGQVAGHVASQAR
ncbi:MAG: polymer-forming cytoskeletal protein [Gammaproteobacteria bacterium PRO9]|nr:polymer-forming cytoskeletal protein [Gammaproteobacteria bacterium PRO9]